MFLVHVAAFSVNDWSDRLFELSDSVSCAIRAPPLLPSCSRPNDLCPYRWTTFLLDFIFSSTFHTFPPGASRIEGRPLAGGNASKSWNGRKQKPTDHHWIPGVVLFQDIPLHCVILVVQSGLMSESSPSIMCTNATLIFETLFQRVLVWTFVADDYWCCCTSRRWVGLQVCGLQVAVAPQSCYTGREGLQRRLLYSNWAALINFSFSLCLCTLRFYRKGEYWHWHHVHTHTCRY